jgi:Ca2+/Na+ antiporter
MTARPVTRREAGGVEAQALPLLVGVAALTFSALYFLSDLIELVQGRFSTPQLALTLVAEAAIPVFVIGLYVVQRPRMRLLGLIGALGYATSFVCFTGTVLFAMVNRTSDWAALSDQLGAWVLVPGAVMVLAGSAFGLAVILADVLPRWTGVALIAGVVLVAVASALPEIAQTAAAGIRDLALAGMGGSLLSSPRAADPAKHPNGDLAVTTR